MFDGVLLDFDDTLVDLDGNDVAAAEVMLDAAGSDLDPRQFVATTLDQLDRAAAAGVTFGPCATDLHTYRVAAALRAHGMVVDTGLIELYRRAFASRVPVLPSAAGTLAQLRGRARLALVTNAIDAGTQRARIVASGLAEHFDVIAIAAEVGASKPDPAIFLWAADHLGVPAHRCVVVGDSESHDVAGAHAAGMVAVRRVATPGGPTAADDVVTDLAHLPSLLVDLWVRRTHGGPLDQGSGGRPGARHERAAPSS